MRIEYSRKFVKEFDKLPIPIQDSFKRRLLMFRENPHSILLHNHALSGSLAGLRSINITGNFRAIFEIEDEDVYFVEIGTHSQLYQK